MHLVLNLPLDGIVIDHFYSVPAGFYSIFPHFSDFLSVEFVLNFSNEQTYIYIYNLFCLLIDRGPIIYFMTAIYI